MARLQEVLILLLIGCSAMVFSLASNDSSCAPAAPGPPPFQECRLQYFVQVLVGDVGLNSNLLPTLNASFSGPFGQGELFAFNVTEGRDRNSTRRGFVRGYTINSAYTAGGVELIEVEFLSYNDGHYQGTVQMQGEIRALPAGSANEVAIIGGTGSFRGARGYVLITRLLVDGPYRLFYHDLHFIH